MLEYKNIYIVPDRCFWNLQTTILSSVKLHVVTFAFKIIARSWISHNIFCITCDIWGANCARQFEVLCTCMFCPFGRQFQGNYFFNYPSIARYSCFWIINTIKLKYFQVYEEHFFCVPAFNYPSLSLFAVPLNKLFICELRRPTVAINKHIGPIF